MSNGNQINYKQKYQELKMKYMESVDAAFRLGYEQGAQQAAQDQMMQQQQQQAEQEAAMSGGPDFGGNGAEGSPAGAEQQANPQSGQPDMPGSENPAGSELDQHIAKLESMLKAEELPNPADLILVTNKIRAMSKNIALQQELKKSAKAIPAIARALHRPAFKIGQQATHNMTSNAKQAVGMQHEIVNNIMKSWEEQESAAAKKVDAVLAIEGLTKKEGQ